MAASLLGLWVRIPAGAWMFIYCECYVLSGRDLCVGLITRPEKSYRLWCVWVWSWILDNEESLSHWGAVPFLSFWCDSPQWARASSFRRFLDHTQRRTTVGRTPLNEWSARRTDLYLKTHYNHNTQTSMPPMGFEPTISAGEQPQTHATDRATNGTDHQGCCTMVNKIK